jgi:hypothetical protein
MSGLLGGAPVTREQQERHNVHRHGLVLAVLGVLLVYLYCFTHIDRMFGLPAPQTVAELLNLPTENIFDDDRNVDCPVSVAYNAGAWSNDDERMALFLGIAVAFLCAYYLPLKWKQPALLGVTCVLLLVLYGWAGIALFTAAHMAVFLVLHSGGGKKLAYAALAGLLGGAGFAAKASIAGFTLAALGGAAGFAALYAFALRPLLRQPKAARVLQTVAVQSAMIVVFAGAFLEGLGGPEWKLPLGILLFFWNWERLMMYHIDHQDGLIPEDISLAQYLGVFFSPGAVGNWNWGVTIGQGYAYVANNFYAEDKNTLLIGGLKLYGVAFLYIVLGDWFHEHLVQFLRSHDLNVFYSVRRMSKHFGTGGEVTTSGVLATTFIDIFRWMFLWGGVVHFKAGTWRLCGYKCDPYFNRPWLATNLVSFWSRFTFHYREFLVRAFYYPAFFALAKKPRIVRVVLATLAAATFGNFVWGHAGEAFFYKGLQFDNLLLMLPTWPYFVLLGLGISVSEIWLLRKKKKPRKPWTLDRRLPLDILAAYVTIQFYGLIHIFFYRQDGNTMWDDMRLFLVGFGIHL